MTATKVLHFLQTVIYWLGLLKSKGWYFHLDSKKIRVKVEACGMHLCRRVKIALVYFTSKMDMSNVIN